MRTTEQVLLGDSGTVEEEELEIDEPVDEPPKRRVIQLSSTILSKNNCQRRADGTAILKFSDSSERLVILGSYGVKVKSGEASIYGASLHPSETIHWVHAPHCHALPVLRCSEKSVLELHPHPAAADLRNLEKLSPLFGGLWHEPVSSGGQRNQTWQVLSTSADGPKKAMIQDLKSPPEWNRKIAELVKPTRETAPVFMVCGPKSSGKSTFSRMLTNRLVTHRGGTKERVWPGVAVLDIDPGQPEFSAPGAISLVRLDEPNLSPPFCHPLLKPDSTVRSHAIASVTPASNIEHYKACVFDLFSHYRSTCPGYPLIINTLGWIQGSGLILLQDLLAEIRPTEVVYMSQDGPEDTVEGLRSAGTRSPLTTLPSQSSEYTSRTALHLRHMQAMSYFHISAEVGAGAAGGTHWDAQPLTSAPPLLVSYTAAGEDSGLLGIACYGYQPQPELLAEAIDGTILAIIEVEDETKAFGIPPSPPAPDGPGVVQRTAAEAQLPYIRANATPLDPRYARCHGLALVRGVDTARGLLALSTPLSPDLLSGRTIVLVSGKFDSPTWAYTEDHYSRASGKGAVGAEVEAGSTGIPWAEVLRGNQKRAAGSKVWRVRRDLGRNSGGGGGGGGI
ncbi:hypothetical protein M406DRAFT_48555 [Cryphonectria parasitica EP155]|uniref:Polynucleotide 5'-hydroxyl-kinase GRC3 n=1 Tax=Cryphonectria parasitica (strain ATCC 38755 / EP155) TaxID=660469 RepID=A0A9P4XZJ1_CRYP1|nr:uncharacterized protein M406DRAFT_48555 [Cryphonectria parasitica EP155]KAF3763660.1 hypothetical protein M406DRAFT_48555 [Cryphonectria parasitica EP155]